MLLFSDCYRPLRYCVFRKLKCISKLTFISTVIAFLENLFCRLVVIAIAVKNNRIVCVFYSERRCRIKLNSQLRNYRLNECLDNIFPPQGRIKWQAKRRT